VALATVEDELRALHELGQVSAALGMSVGSNKGGLLAVYTAGGDRIARDQKLAAFWQHAFLPSHARAQIYAIEQAVQLVSPYGGALDDLMVHRATMILDALRAKSGGDAGLAAQVPRLTALVAGAGKRKGAQTKILLMVCGGIFGVPIVLFIIGSVVQAVFSRGSGGSDANGGSERTVACKFTEETRSVACTAADAEACKQLPKEILCRSAYLDAVSERVNNWKKKGIWEKNENKITWIDLPVNGPEEHEGKKCWKASQEATVWLCPRSGDAPAASEGHFSGYGKMTSYEQNMLTDDLEIEVLEVLPGPMAAQEKALRELSKLGTNKEAIEKWLSGPGANVDPKVVAAEFLVLGVSPSEFAARAQAQKLARSASDTKAKAESAEREKEQEKKRAAAAPVTYPVPCAAANAATHVAVEGAPQLCVPQGEGILVASLLAGHHDSVSSLPAMPSSYDDEDPVAVLLGPDRTVGEKSTLSGGERAQVAAKTRARVFAKIQSTTSWGEWKWVDSLGKLTGVLDLGGERLIEGEPSIQRKQKCETDNNMRCGGRCDDDGDCMKLFSGCGCPESTCHPLFHVCSGCPAMSHCDDPEFPMTIPKKTVSAVFSKAEERERAKAAAEGAYGLLLTKISGAWRKTYTKMEKSSPDEKPERKTEHDTGYYARIAPLGFFVLKCDDDRCGSTAEQLVSFSASPWSVTIGENPKVEVKCQNGICKAKVAK
jgi:hypothetical protein